MTLMAMGINFELVGFGLPHVAGDYNLLFLLLTHNSAGFCGSFIT